jgi:hypothetical protein
MLCLLSRFFDDFLNSFFILPNFFLNFYSNKAVADGMGVDLQVERVDEKEFVHSTSFVSLSSGPANKKAWNQGDYAVKLLVVMDRQNGETAVGGAYRSI